MKLYLLFYHITVVGVGLYIIGIVIFLYSNSVSDYEFKLSIFDYERNIQFFLIIIGFSIMITSTLIGTVLKPTTLYKGK